MYRYRPVTTKGWWASMSDQPKKKWSSAEAASWLAAWATFGIFLINLLTLIIVLL